MSDLILYTSEDGKTRMQLRVEGQTIWLTQLEIAELFQTTKNNVSIHTKNIFEEGELTPGATVKESLTVQTEGNRRVERTITYYNLDLILAIGYRVRSARGTQFRQWATTHLREYLVKGFVMDDDRLKNPGGWDYFDELLERIREIRASEKRFYQKVREELQTISIRPRYGSGPIPPRLPEWRRVMERIVYKRTDIVELLGLQRSGAQIVCPECGTELVIALDVETANKLKVHPGIYCPVDRKHVCEITELGSVRRDLWRNLSRKAEGDEAGST